MTTISSLDAVNNTRGVNSVSSVPPLASSGHPNSWDRYQLSRHLHGHGVEFGPGCHPLPLGPFAESIQYCDAFDRPSFARAFPEVSTNIEFFPDYIDFQLNFDTADFVETIGKGSRDFLVANHVLEHLVNPIRFLEQCYDVLNDDGLLYIGLPDKRAIFDRDRQRTPIETLVRRYRNQESQLDAETVIEYVNQVDRPATRFDESSPNFEAELERHRQRSLHVNVWLVDDFIEILQLLADELGMFWSIVDGAILDDEFLLLLRKSQRGDVTRQYSTVMARLWAESNRRHIERQYEPRLNRLEDLAESMLHQLKVTDERMRD